MAKPKTKQAPTERIVTAAPPDPNRCFVLFSCASFTAGTATVSLNSLVRQIEKQPKDRPIEAIRFDPDRLMMEVLFVPLEGGNHIGEHRTSPCNSL